MKERIYWLDNLKGILILIVILGHTILFTSGQGDSNIVYRYICSFWMAVFMFTSGFACYKPEPRLSVIKRRFIQLVVPFVAWSIVLCVINKDPHIDQLILFPVKSVWFLWALFCINSIMVICCNVSLRFTFKEEYTCLMAAFVMLILSKYFPNNTLFAVNLISLHFVNFAVGYFSRKYFTCLSNLPHVIWYVGGSMFVVMAYFNQGSFMPFGLPSSLHILYDIVCGIVSFMSIIPLFFKHADCKMLYISKMGGYFRPLYNAYSHIYFINQGIWKFGFRL